MTSKKILPFKFNPNVSYKSNIKYSIKDKELPIKIINQIIFVNQKDSFKVSFPDLFQKYQNPPLHTIHHGKHG